MSKKSSKHNTANAWGLILCLGALPLLGGMIGCVGNRYKQSTGEHIDDRAASARVSAALGNDPQHKFFAGVNVKTFKGVVQLSGFVNSRALRNRAGEIARHVEGIRDVRNNITLKE